MRVSTAKLAVAAALALSALCHPAGADDAQAGRVRKACATDYRTHCTGDRPALSVERACLKQYFLNLSAGCQAALSPPAESATPAEP